MNTITNLFGYRITVEPILFMYMFSVFMNFPAMQDLIYVKVSLIYVFSYNFNSNIKFLFKIYLL